MRPAAIAFDLDGTLIDTAGGVMLALNTALASAGLAGFEFETVRGWIGDGPDVLIEHALRASQPLFLDLAQQVPALRRAFDAATLAAPMAGCRVFDGITELLHTLRNELQIPLVVVTNKPTPLARAVLEEAELLPFFAAVYGADQPTLRKPSPRLLWRAAAALKVTQEALLMVGDAEPDLGAARAAGSPAALANWGYGRVPANDPTLADVWRLQRPHDLLSRLCRQDAPAMNS